MAAAAFAGTGAADERGRRALMAAAAFAGTGAADKRVLRLGRHGAVGCLSPLLDLFQAG